MIPYSGAQRNFLSASSAVCDFARTWTGFGQCRLLSDGALLSVIGYLFSFFFLFQVSRSSCLDMIYLRKLETAETHSPSDHFTQSRGKRDGRKRKRRLHCAMKSAINIYNIYTNLKTVCSQNMTAGMCMERRRRVKPE